jgi:hypothetical protein
MKTILRITKVSLTCLILALLMLQCQTHQEEFAEVSKTFHQFISVLHSENEREAVNYMASMIKRARGDDAGPYVKTCIKAFKGKKPKIAGMDWRQSDPPIVWLFFIFQGENKAIRGRFMIFIKEGNRWKVNRVRWWGAGL